MPTEEATTSRVAATLGRPAAVTAAILGPLGPAQLTCIRSWKEKGYKVVFVHVAQSDKKNFMITGLVDGYLPISQKKLQTRDGVAALSAFLRKHRACGITAVAYGMIAFLWRIRSDLPPGVELWVTSQESLSLLQSKRRQIALATEVGLPVLDTWYVFSEADIKIPAKAFPLAVRPDVVGAISPGFKLLVAASSDELLSIVRSLRRIDHPLVLQPYTKGYNVAVHGYRSPTTGDCDLSAFAVRWMFEGVTLSIHPTRIPPSLATKCRNYIARSKLEGVYHFEFLFERETKTYYFLDLNGRLGGTTGKVFRCGYDEPDILVRAFAGEKISLPALAGSRATTATNKLAILKLILHKLGGSLERYDKIKFPLSTLLYVSIAGLFLWKDEIVSIRYFRSTLAFLYQAARRW